MYIKKNYYIDVYLKNNILILFNKKTILEQKFGTNITNMAVDYFFWNLLKFNNKNFIQALTIRFKIKNFA